MEQPHMPVRHEVNMLIWLRARRSPTGTARDRGAQRGAPLLSDHPGPTVIKTFPA